MTDETWLRMALMCVSEPGDERLHQRIQRDGIEKTWASITGPGRDSVWGRRAVGLDVDAVMRATKRSGFTFLTPGMAGWPARLEDLAECRGMVGVCGAPLGLWIRGEVDLAELAAESVAIVGSRAATPYGEMMAADIAGDLAVAGWRCISGGAFGIDAAAHRGTLAARGRTVCVLACGVDQDYPRAHHDLLGDISRHGAVISELPPGAHPTRSRFLARNRVIAALASGTLLVEAALRSGARNTTNWADALGRRIMAVPGPARSATSVTPHELIRSHMADLVTSAADVMDLLGPMGEQMLPLPALPHRALDDIGPEERTVFEAFPGTGTASVREVVRACGLSAEEVEWVLGRLVERRGDRSGGERQWGMVSGSVG